MEFNKLVNSRRSVRRFKSKKPDWRDLIDAINYASKIPYAGNIQNIKFILINDKKTINEITKYCQQDFILQASYIIVITADPTDLVRSYDELGEKYNLEQGGAATQQLLLKVVDLGLDGCWIGAFDEEAIKRILKIPKEVRVSSIVPVGYAMPGERTIKKSLILNLDKILRFNDYKQKFMKPRDEPEAF